MSDRMRLAMVYAMYSSCGLEVGHDDDCLYVKGTSSKANGEYLGYHPKFMGIGTSDKIATRIKSENGEVISIKSYDKNGNITSETDNR